MLKKQFLKSKPVCKVTFSLPAEVQGETAFLVGDFNNWDEQATEMKRLKSGSFTITLDLEIGRDYQFRYLVNGSEWHNDWEADRYVPNPYSGDNSVISRSSNRLRKHAAKFYALIRWWAIRGVRIAHHRFFDQRFLRE